MHADDFINSLKNVSFHGITFVKVGRDPQLRVISLKACMPTPVFKSGYQVLGRLRLTYPLILSSSRKSLFDFLEQEAFKMIQKRLLSNSSRLRPNLIITDDMEPDWVPPSDDPEDQAYSVKEIEPFNLEGYKKSAV